MKKTLLLSMALLGAAASSMAYEPLLLPEFYSLGISRDGEWLLSDTSMEQVIYNIKQQKAIAVFDNFVMGNGNKFAKDGTLVGSTDMDEPVIIRNGEMENPAILMEAGSFMINGIQYDGSRIVGTMSNPDDSAYHTTYLPAYADIDADGTVKAPVVLPFPEKDFFGETPQYCSATWISDDGKTILGQIIDASGMLISPIVYTLSDSGEWSYSLPTKDLFNPNHIELPENPGEFETPQPNPEDYMTEEQKQAREAAYEAWVAGGYGDGYPEYKDYMDPDKYAEYSADLAAWEAERDAAMEKYNAYLEVRNQIIDESPSFEQNIACLNPDGKKFIAARVTYIESEGSWMPESIYETWIFDLTNNTHKYIDSKYNKVLCNQILADGTILGSTAPDMMSSTPSTSYVLLPDASDYIPFDKYYETKNPAVYSWITENLIAEVAVEYDPETFEPIYEDILCTGNLVASDDFNIVACGILAYVYPHFSDNSFLSYVIDNEKASVNSISADGQAVVKILKDGTLLVKGEIENLTICDLAGRCLYSADKVSGTVATGLSHGIYVVTYNNSGTKTAQKINL